MSDWLDRTFGPDWPGWAVYTVAAMIFIIGMGYGLWKGNGE